MSNENKKLCEKGTEISSVNTRTTQLLKDKILSHIHLLRAWNNSGDCSVVSRQPMTTNMDFTRSVFLFCHIGVTPTNMHTWNTT